MAYSASTPNYHLPLPTDDDRSVWTDNNDAFTRIDTALKDVADAVATFQSTIDDLSSRVQAIEDDYYIDTEGIVRIEEDGTGLTNAEYAKLTKMQGRVQ